mgnify:CR=1 FL=1
MVGAKIMITYEQKKLISKIVIKYFDKEFKLGENDCLTTLINFYGDMGFKLPLEFNGIRIDSYAEKWLMGELRDEFEAYLEFVTRPVRDAVIGDILIMKGAELDWWAVNLGNGNMLATLEDFGTKVLPIKFFKVIEARRIKEVYRG